MRITQNLDYKKNEYLYGDPPPEEEEEEENPISPPEEKPV